MQINRWRNFKDKDTFFTLGWLLLKFVEYPFLEFFFLFVSLSKSVLLLRRYLMFWNFDAGEQKNNFCFYSILSETFPNSCGFALYKNLIFSLLTLYFIIGNIFIQFWLIWATFHTGSLQKFLLLISDLKKYSHRTLSKNAAVR